MPTAEPLVPAGLESVITGVVGLDDLAQPTPQLVRADKATSTARFSGASAVDQAPAHALLAAQATSGPQADCSAMTGAGLTATQLAQAYSFSALYGAGTEGQGTTIGIFELEPYLPSDVSSLRELLFACHHTARQRGLRERRRPERLWRCPERRVRTLGFR